MANRKMSPWYAESKSWEEIENFYIQLINAGLKFGPMVNLIQHIRSTGISARIFAFTSMHKLVIGIYDKIDRRSEALNVEFDTDTREFLFVYHPKPYVPTEFNQTCDEEAGIQKFMKFIDLMKW